MINILLIPNNAYSYLLVLYFNPKTFTVDHLVTQSKLGHRRRSSVNFGGGNAFLPEIMYEKLTKCSNFTWYLPKKINKISWHGHCIKKEHISDRPFWRDFWGTKMLKNPNFPGLCHHWGSLLSLHCSPDLLAGGKGTQHLPEIYARILHYVCPKNIFRDFFLGGGGQPLVWGWAPGPPPGKSGPGRRQVIGDRRRWASNRPACEHSGINLMQPLMSDVTTTRHDTPKVIYHYQATEQNLNVYKKGFVKFYFPQIFTVDIEWHAPQNM